MSQVMRVAEAVTRALEDYGAVLSFYPEYGLGELERLHVTVVPVGTEYRRLSRQAHEELPKVQVGIMKRCGEDELPDMLRLAERLGRGFLGRRLEDASCIGVNYDPIYSPEALRERRQFISVFELTFRIVSAC